MLAANHGRSLANSFLKSLAVRHYEKHGQMGKRTKQYGLIQIKPEAAKCFLRGLLALRCGQRPQPHQLVGGIAKTVQLETDLQGVVLSSEIFAGHFVIGFVGAVSGLAAHSKALSGISKVRISSTGSAWPITSLAMAHLPPDTATG